MRVLEKKCRKSVADEKNTESLGGSDPSTRAVRAASDFSNVTVPELALADRVCKIQNSCHRTQDTLAHEGSP